MIVESISDIVGGLISEYCTGIPTPGRPTLPPLRGIEEDFMTLYKST